MSVINQWVSHKKVLCPRCRLPISKKPQNLARHLEACDGRPMTAKDRRIEKLTGKKFSA